jgi:hypothetical protein
MKYTLEVPDHDADFVLEVLRLLGPVKLTPVGHNHALKSDPSSLPTNRAARERLLEAAELLKGRANLQRVAISDEERAHRFEAVAGSWQSEESGDELNKQLRAVRYFRDRDVEL